MALVHLHQVSLAFAGPPLLDAVDLAIEDGERIGLLGRNGAGKSTLLRVLEGVQAADAGEIVRKPGLRVAALLQDVPTDLHGRVRDYLHAACGVAASEHAWQVETRIDHAARDLRLDLEADIATLSAGSKRRVLLAAALVREPELLLLDEPTNHLDLEAIAHLEDALRRRRGTLVFVTHDRAFLRALATRILEVDRGRVRRYEGDYDAYLLAREHERTVEAEQAAQFDKRLAEEEVWIRRGIQARRTRNEGRVRRLEAMRLERGVRRDETGRVEAALQDAGRSGRRVLQVEGLGFAYGEKCIVQGLDLTVQRGDRIGILGPNGSGKTTLLRLLLGELAPTSGTVTQGTRLELAHFDQLHDSLDPTKTVQENVVDGRETVRVGDGERHVVGYLRDFLFTPEQMRGPITKLSGGERRRLQLARILSRPCNVLVLDEPTNDLDLETLELLEELLLEFTGTILAVSHDRAFLDAVATSTLVAEGGGVWREYVGGYADWLRQRAPDPAAAAKREPRKNDAPRAESAKPRKLGFNEKRELEQLPPRIEKLEAERGQWFERMAAPDFYARGAEVATAKARLAELEAEIENAFARWAELDAIANGRPD